MLARQVANCLTQSDLSSTATFDPSQNLIHGRAFGKATELGGQVLLQRLPSLIGAALELAVYVVGHITNKHIGHAYIMQACVVGGNRRHQAS